MRSIEEMPRLNVPHWNELNIDYPFFPLDRSERKTGTAKPGRFRDRVESAVLQDHPKLKELCELCDLKYHKGGRWSDYGYFVLEGFDAPEVWSVMSAILKSPYPNHLQRFASLALGLYNWFGKATPEQMQEFEELKRKQP